MSVKVGKTDNKNELKLEFIVDSKVFEEGMKTVYKKNVKYFSIPGFRKGKVPKIGRASCRERVFGLV